MTRKKSSSPPHLGGEVKLLRTVMRQLVDRMEDELPFKDLVRALDILSIASTRLATLLKTEKSLEPAQDAWGEELTRAMMELQADLQKKPES